MFEDIKEGDTLWMFKGKYEYRDYIGPVHIKNHHDTLQFLGKGYKFNWKNRKGSAIWEDDVKRNQVIVLKIVPKILSILTGIKNEV